MKKSRQDSFIIFNHLIDGRALLPTCCNSLVHIIICVFTQSASIQQSRVRIISVLCICHFTEGLPIGYQTWICDEDRINFFLLPQTVTNSLYAWLFKATSDINHIGY